MGQKKITEQVGELIFLEELNYALARRVFYHKQGLDPIHESIFNTIQKIADYPIIKYNPNFMVPAYVIRNSSNKDEALENMMDVVQLANDIIGFIPGAGEVFDGINAAIYVARGMWFEAAVSLISLVPEFGDVPAKLGKAIKMLTGKTVQLGNKAAKLTEAEFLEAQIEKNQTLLLILEQKENPLVQKINSLIEQLKSLIEKGKDFITKMFNDFYANPESVPVINSLPESDKIRKFMPEIGAAIGIPVQKADTGGQDVQKSK